jgi:hypothetical protein
MNSFAKPEEAMPYTYTDFPAPLREERDFSFSDNPASRKFVPFDPAQHIIEKEPLPTVQGVRFQDFKEVLSASS